MSIHITGYNIGVVSYTKDHIPSKLTVTEKMMRDTFSYGESKMYPMILGLVDHELVILIGKYHTLENHRCSFRISEHLKIFPGGPY